jgi:hypothetical protein
MNTALDALATELYVVIDDMLIDNPHPVPARPPVGIAPQLSDDHQRSSTRARRQQRPPLPRNGGLVVVLLGEGEGDTGLSTASTMGPFILAEPGCGRRARRHASARDQSRLTDVA